MRLAHISDIHLAADRFDWRPGDWVGKRATGWLNLRFGRGKRFRHAALIMKELMRTIRERACDHVVFSGDATTLGFTTELSNAASLCDFTLPGLAVPGNHDYYVRRAERSGAFERVFAAWQKGRRVGTEAYPFAQQVGDIWLIGVNSACANPLLWDARGRVGAGQLRRLRELLAELPPGPRVLVTHYPLVLDDGRPEHRWRLLRDAGSLLRIAMEGKISLWLHGHRHTGYVVPATAARPFPIICAGSATQEGRWSWNEYLFDGPSFTTIFWRWNAEKQTFTQRADAPG